MDDSEDKTRVVILTAHYQVKGQVSLYKGARLTDFLIDSRPFIAVTGAEVVDGNGRSLLTVPFLNFYRDSIEIIAPDDCQE